MAMELCKTHLFMFRPPVILEGLADARGQRWKVRCLLKDYVCHFSPLAIISDCVVCVGSEGERPWPCPHRPVSLSAKVLGVSVKFYTVAHRRQEPDFPASMVRQDSLSLVNTLGPLSTGPVVGTGDGVRVSVVV